MTAIWKTAETYDIVCAAIAIILIIFTLIFFAHSAIISIKEKKRVKENKNLHFGENKKYKNL